MNKYKITNKSFESGPLILTKSGYYYLCEDIYINFLQNKDDIWKHNNNNNFGFTAGIIIVGNDIILDLNGFSIQQSLQDYCLQRFFALIQLNDMPFNIGQGPILELRTKLQTGKNITIKNGTLGLTSHQAILGNNNKNLKLENITVSNFEVTGITLNATENLKFYNSKICSSNTNIPITPYFSGFIFIFKLLATIKSMENKKEVNDLIQNIMDKIKSYYQPYIEKIYQVKKLDEIINNFEKNDLFINFDKNTLCNMHGIKITGANPSVHNFHNSVNIDNKLNSKNIKLRNLTIENLSAKTNEDFLLGYKDKSLHIGSGVILSLNFITSNTKITNFVISVIEMIVKLIQKYPDLNKYIKTNITADILNSIKKISIGEKLTNDESKNFFIMRNCDVMGHINKGTIGIRLGSSIDCDLKNISIDNITNNGIINDNLEIYKNKYNISNVKVLDSGSDGIKNISGNYAIGLISSGISKSKFNKLFITNIESTNSKGIGLFINNESNNVNIKKTEIKNINSNNEINDCSTILIDEKAKKIILSDVKIN
jgi:hypothetical protein